MSIKLQGGDLRYVQKIQDAVDNETYDELNEDQWEIIDTLLSIINAYTEK